MFPPEYSLSFLCKKITTTVCSDLMLFLRLRSAVNNMHRLNKPTLRSHFLTCGTLSDILHRSFVFIAHCLLEDEDVAMEICEYAEMGTVLSEAATGPKRHGWTSYRGHYLRFFFPEGMEEAAVNAYNSRRYIGLLLETNEHPFVMKWPVPGYSPMTASELIRGEILAPDLKSEKPVEFPRRLRFGLTLEQLGVLGEENHDHGSATTEEVDSQLIPDNVSQLRQGILPSLSASPPADSPSASAAIPTPTSVKRKRPRKSTEEYPAPLKTEAPRKRSAYIKGQDKRGDEQRLDAWIATKPHHDWNFKQVKEKLDLGVNESTVNH
jgi:hypothetical protein